jgi:catecholate siderophore receptor
MRSPFKLSRPLAAKSALLGVASLSSVTAALAQQAVGSDQPKNDALETVTVTAKRTTLDTLTAKVLNTPQSIDVIPQQVITQQGVSSLQDALKNVPGITLNAGEGGSHGDQVNLRGFSAGDDFFLDGLRDTGFYTRDTFNDQNLEVFKGPASTLFGRGSTGGVVNQVSKKPELFPIEDAAIALGTNDEIRTTADVNYVTGNDSAFRINFMGQTSSVEGRPYVRNNRWGVAPSIAFGIGTDTTFSLEYLHQQEDNLPDFGIPFLFGKPAPVSLKNFYGLPTDDRQKTDVEIVTGRFEHQFSDSLSISDTARFGSYWFDTRQTGPTYGDANCFDAATPPYPGAPLCSATTDPNPVTDHDPLYPALGTPLNQIYVLRDRPSERGTITTLMNELDLNSRFMTGSWKHTLVTGLEVDREVGDLDRLENQDDIILPSPLLAPDPFEAFPGHQTGTEGLPVTTATTVGVFAVDNVEINDRWSLVGALRFDHFAADFHDVFNDARYSHDDNIVSPRAAIIYKPSENSSIYFSYGTSFDPAAANLSLASSNDDLAPERDRTFELGGKVVALDGLLGITAAVFTTRMTNARTADPEDPGEQTFSGTLRANGFEVTANGRLTPNWEITAGYVYLDTLDLQSQGPGLIGPIPNTAHNQANIWTVYDLDERIRLGLGANYTGSRSAGFDTLTVPGTLIIAKLPDYITLDAMIGYKFSDTISVQLNGYNLADKKYFSSAYFNSGAENHAVPGGGRSALLTLNIAR